ncbi:hypothetical protein HCN51_54205 [Nonomuraea sp. FMUSA5-5]|uniref:Uncharacterized protein n=1 Tax=Nonomuraea composti TaxID=2720023 RepID=A0ABX1BR05_9ACTN|nr:hypothetical protein [Nonomuraea sp. FMUSA5-5]NJP98284.1 hypothetical protein [Nonomuraea sp. FMUSA5-5]
MDLFADDPVAAPLTYPGRIPPGSGVLMDDAYVPREWRAGGAAIAALLASAGQAPLDARHRVVAVGSNAAPSQLRRKFRDHGVRAVVPMTLAEVPGVAPGVSAHVSRWGYVPAAPIETQGEASRLFVLWLDERQLAALDLTEPNYRRRPLTSAVTLEDGTPLPPPFVYEGRHGCVAAPGDGRPRRLTSQPELIRSLLDGSAALRRLCGSTPEEFVANVRDDTVREAAYLLLQRERTGGG